ncbi:hypothetical protein YPPY54_3344 [Yersinia pestis PY-54]|nr:hypothetical protein YPPY54_3344 [Yersinia pestis PY-54]
MSARYLPAELQPELTNLPMCVEGRESGSYRFQLSLMQASMLCYH